MNAEQILQRIAAEKVIVIVRGVAPQKMVAVMQALLEGGLSCAEITFDHRSAQGLANTLESLRLIRDAFGSRIALGVGTVLTVQQVEQAVEAGADYIISPNTDVQVICRTKELGKVSIPGAFTPSEVVVAHQAGADIVKLFPAALMGVAYVKALRDPLAHIPVSAVGGVSSGNIKDFIAAGCVGVGVGANIVNAQLATQDRYAEITQNARQFVAALK